MLKDKNNFVIDRKLMKRQRIALYDAWGVLKDVGMPPSKRIRLRNAIDGVTEMMHCMEDRFEEISKKNSVVITISEGKFE